MFREVGTGVDDVGIEFREIGNVLGVVSSVNEIVGQRDVGENVIVSRGQSIQ